MSDKTPRILTESRVAIGISAFALVFSAWQSYESNKANAFNGEDIIVEVIYQHPFTISCGQIDFKSKSYRVNLSILLINNSVQPVVIREIRFDQMLLNGTNRAWASPNNKLAKGLEDSPLTLAGKSHMLLDYDHPFTLSESIFKGFSEDCSRHVGSSKLANKSPGNADAVDAPSPNATGNANFSHVLNFPKSLDAKVWGFRAEVWTSSGRVFPGILQYRKIQLRNVVY